MKIEKQQIVSKVKTVMIIVNIGLIIFAFWLTTKTPSVNIPTGAQASDLAHNRQAYYMCKHFIKKRLNDPGSLDFPDSNTAHITSTGDTYDIAGSFRANNALGAKIQTSYACTVTENRDRGTWTLDYLSEF